MIIANKELPKRPLLSRAVSVPSIEEREKMAAAVREAANINEYLATPMATAVFAAMMNHCARREARQGAKKKV